MSKKKRLFEQNEVELDTSEEPSLEESKSSEKSSKTIKFNDQVDIYLFTRSDGDTPIWVSESKAKALEIKVSQKFLNQDEEEVSFSDMIEELSKRF